MQNIKLIAVASALIASLALTGCEKAQETQAEPTAQTQEAPATANAPAPVAVEVPAATDASQTKPEAAAPAAEDGKTADQHTRLSPNSQLMLPKQNNQ